MASVRAFIALGSNLGQPVENLRAAAEALGAEDGVELQALSGFERTTPVGGPQGQPDYLNAVARIETCLEPLELLDRLQAIEACLGRERSDEERWGPRLLDLDLLYYGELTIETSRLVVPHPRAEERLFVLEPLAEIAPGLRLPIAGIPIERRIEELRATQGCHS